MKKLKIDEMKVKSFVTSLENGKINTCKGGLEPVGELRLRTIESPTCLEDRKTKYPVCQYA